MSNFNSLKKQLNESTNKINKGINELGKVNTEMQRVAYVAHNAGKITDDIDDRFEKATKLNKVDVVFLFAAIALQCLRQYFLTPFNSKNGRPNDQKAAGNKNEHSDRHHRLYNPSLEEIWSNPVPFDAHLQQDNVKGALKGGGKLGHRSVTLGHDPILGWVFGTANIATSTLTTWDLQSYHVKTGMVNKRNGNLSPEDFLTNNADTMKVFSYTKDKLLNQGIKGKIIVASSIAKEAEHLYSDVNSKNSLPFPIVSKISPDIANTLADYGIDACNILKVGEQAALSAMINYIIAVIHRLMFDESSGLTQSMYEVKTRKILSYSNAIASSSNIIYIVISKELNKLDIGGIAVTLYRLISDYKFISSIKREFLENEWYNTVMGNFEK